MPVSVRQLFARRLLGRVAEAYGRMLLLSGLFQADCHPGNILVSESGKLGALSPSHGLHLLPCLYISAMENSSCRCMHVVFQALHVMQVMRWCCD
jgi:hypothetical protein